ncbi:MAG: penicillin acylase family protein [Bacteroidales bacterium]|nr:penicillin acylase family protein [Bacteroidales bacterium]
MKPNYRLRLATILSLTILLLASCSQNETTRWNKHVKNTTIFRDNYGVAHVYGKTDADAVFGMIYAQCEDDFNRVEVNYINSMGRMAEVEGESQIYNDLRMKLFIDPEVVKQEFEESPEWLKKLMVAFADGANFYLKNHPEVKPKLITRFEPWMALTFTEGSIGGDIESISAAQLRAFYGPQTTALNEVGGENYYGTEAQLTDGTIGEPAEVAAEVTEWEPTGSNGIAIAPSITTSGNAMLLINPHTSFYFRPELKMVSEEGLNAYGAVTWGQFFIYQGFNEKCGWMHTSSRADVIDHYLITIEEKDGKYFYKYGDELRPVTEKVIAIPYKDGDTTSVREITAYYTHHGPIIREQNGKWVAIKLMVEHIDALTQSYMRTKATNLDEFNKTMELKTNSSNNTVYADADGNIVYYHGNFMPRRDTSFDWSGTIDGSNPATEWQGLHNLDEMIVIKNPGNGWIQNCNSTPFTAAAEYSPKREDYPPYMAYDTENARGIHAVMVLSDKKDFTLDALLEAAYDSYLPGFAESIPAVVAAYDIVARTDRALREKLAGPVEALRNWDLRFSVESVPMSVAHYYSQSRQPGTGEGRESATVSRERRLVENLSRAIDNLTEDFGTWQTPWGEINRFQRLTGDIAGRFDDNEFSLPVAFASANHGSLAAFGATKFPGTKRIYGTRGNSFVAVVEFGDKVVARSSLAGGVNGDPNSPYFMNQALDYTLGKFKEVQFYKDDLLKAYTRMYKPGEE